MLDVKVLGFPNMCYQNSFFYCKMMNEIAKRKRFQVMGGWNMVALPSGVTPIDEKSSWTAEIHCVVFDTDTHNLYDITEDFDSLKEKLFIIDPGFTKNITHIDDYNTFMSKIAMWIDCVVPQGHTKGYLREDNYRYYNNKIIIY